jgi:O-antigen ligase
MAPTMTKYRLPRFAGIALLWLVVIDALGHVSVGPLSLSGVLTIATAGLVMSVALLHIATWATGNMRPFKNLEVGVGIPRVLMAFLAVAWIRLALTPSTEGIQNVSVYTAFIGGAAILALGAAPSRIVTMLRRFRLVALLVPLVFVASTLAGVSIFHERAFALTALIFVAVLIPYQGRRLIYKIGPILVVAAIFLSLSRTAAVIAAALLIFTAIRSRRRYRFIRAAGFAGVVGAGLYWAVTSYTPFRDRFLGGDQALSLGGVALNTSGRSTLWEITTESASKAPWFGHGPGSANELISGMFDNIAHPHNDYMRLYHDFGLVGLSLFSVGIVMTFRQLWKRARHTDDQVHWIAVIALSGVLAAAFTDNVIVYPFVMVPLGVLIGCSLAQPLPRKRRRYYRRPAEAEAPLQPTFTTSITMQQRSIDRQGRPLLRVAEHKVPSRYDC